jgi:5-methylcytosine-specific restriction endonuclease McrA
MGRIYSEATKEQARIRAKAWYYANKERYQVRYKEWYEENKKQHNASSKAYYEANKERVSTKQKPRLLKDRLDAITHYGGKCAYCGEDRFEFLAFDHINDDGASHRKVIGKRNIAPWLKHNNYPEGFQILCHNCNLAKNIQARRSETPSKQTKWRHKVRQEALEHYGGRCVCCGETNPILLSFDHVNNDGAEHRRRDKYGSLPVWLKQNAWPTEGYQVLCYNCNLSKGYYGYCPHQTNGDKL